MDMSKEEQRMWMSRLIVNSKARSAVAARYLESFQGLEHQGDEPQLSPQSYLLHVTYGSSGCRSYLYESSRPYQLRVSHVTGMLEVRMKCSCDGFQ
jgi:hypothetical protein